LNELSSKLESNEKSVPIKTNDEIGTTSDSLETFDNGKSEDWCRVNDSVTAVSAKPNDNKKSMPTLTNDEIAFCSDKEFSFENEEWNRNAANCGGTDCG
jgi:hypothetical protein